MLLKLNLILWLCQEAVVVNPVVKGQDHGCGARLLRLSPHTFHGRSKKRAPQSWSHGADTWGGSHLPIARPASSLRMALLGNELCFKP